MAGKLAGGEDTAGVEQALVRHQQPAGAGLGHGDRGGQVGVDPLAVAGQLGQLLLDRLLLVETGLLRVEEGDADHQVGHPLDPLHEGKRAVAVEGGADVAGGAGVAVEEHVLPRDLDVVEDDRVSTSSTRLASG